MPEHLFFYLGLSLIFIHKMDAVRCKEWRIFPGLHHKNLQAAIDETSINVVVDAATIKNRKRHQRQACEQGVLV